jgi:hypothetical protein
MPTRLSIMYCILNLPFAQKKGRLKTLKHAHKGVLITLFFIKLVYERRFDIFPLVLYFRSHLSALA